MATAKNTYSVGTHYSSFIARQVEGGRFNNASEVVRAGLRMLEDYETRLRDVRALIDEGDEQIAQGKYSTYKNAGELSDEIISRGMERLNQES